MEKSRIAVIGAGAIGGITAALMAEKGYDVWLVCKHMEIADVATAESIPYLSTAWLPWKN